MSGPSLEEALRTLGEAHGPSELAAAFARLQGTVQRRRRAEPRAVGVLSRTIMEALRLRDTMRAQGATPSELDAYFEKVVRQAWPKGREWTYRCERCGDYGLEMATCDGGERPTCGRSKPHLAHDVGTPCFCSNGARFRQPERRAEDFTQAGAVTRRPSRFGR